MDSDRFSFLLSILLKEVSRTGLNEQNWVGPVVFFIK